MIDLVRSQHTEIPRPEMDESMEISSDRGHDHVDEIDIDLDITHENNDDDYMVEDAKPEGGDPRDDDVMLDDDQVSLNMADAEDISVAADGEMKDAQPVEALELNLESETVPAPDNEISWADPVIDDAFAVTPADVTEQAPGAPPTTSVTQVEVVEEVTNVDAIQTPTEQAISVQEPAQNEVQEQVEAVEIVDSLKTHEGGEDKPESLEKSDPENVIVTYQDSDYALFASSESEDPDTYFLKASGISGKPLKVFLAALRDIIQDDVGFDEEVCLAVEDLGLEIAESSSAVETTTFSQIYQVYRSLQKNDGVVSPGPLHIVLATKPDFSKRLEHLSNSAAEGKGLSQVVSWEDESEENGEESEAHQDVDESGNPSEHDVEGSEAESENLSPTADTQQPQAVSSSSSPKDVQTQGDDLVDTTSKVVESGHSSVRPESAQDDQDESGVDEDGDFIDYDEGATHDEAPELGTGQTNAPEPKDELQTTEQDATEDNAEALGGAFAEDDEVTLQEKLTLVAEPEIQNNLDESNDELQRNDESLDDGFDLFPDEQQEIEETANQAVGEDALLGPDERETHSDHPDDELDYEEVYEDDLEGNEDPSGTGFNIGEPTRDLTFPAPVEETIEETELDYLGKDDVLESNESESTLAAEAPYDPVGQTASQFEDEIGYDEDDQTNEAFDAKTLEPVARRDSSSKRSHGEIEGDELTNGTTNDVKRVRS